MCLISYEIHLHQTLNSELSLLCAYNILYFKTIKLWNVARFLRCMQGGQADSLDRGNSRPKKKKLKFVCVLYEKRLQYYIMATMSINTL